MTRVKICGLMTESDVSIVNETKPDFAGLVFAKGRHHLNSTQAEKLARQIDSPITKVGVFVDTPANEIIELSKRGIFTIAQLHGYGDPQMIGELKVAGIKVIRVFVNEEPDNEYTADYKMIDSGYGSGRLLDISRYENLGDNTFVAGGLTPDNVNEVIEKLNPYAVDVSSGVETNNHKDFQKVRQFIEKVRRD
ncbi:phosphoribosylanthranilate isomerase [Lentilactobacillus sp. Marseille-Q4993]|uniref:phosphoribosylanthranilate isomerase n=1 Tax=Lentilactobacillus sp. Marseille-Q4993 TaxID=3039492 RepID=UPI0024BD1985|nr:phosphoribosylanthranilate isomerase [Lentilactobacillus sp. Marseille-Q4993]